MWSLLSFAEMLILPMKRELEFEDATENGKGHQNGTIDKDAISQRLEVIYKRLEEIDADTAEARASSILAVSFFSLLKVNRCINCG